MKRVERSPTVCFVAPKNYPLLAGHGDLRHIGGAEVQRLLIARELVRRGFAVRFVTLDYGQPDGIEHEGIRVYKMCAAEAGWPGLRFVHPRWTSLWAALARADADVYYQRTAGVESGQVALWCRRNRRTLVLAIASDIECDPRLPGKAARERWFFHYALRRADAVVAQTALQARRLADQFGVAATVIRSCAPTPAETSPTVKRPPEPRVLWVGRFAAPKRPELVLELATLCPEWHFDVVGEPNSPGRNRAHVYDALRALPNVTLHGFVPYARIGARYDAAALLLCTSAWEGYPNTFLEAWSRGLSVVSTVDPDGVIRRHGLGRIAGGSAHELRAAIGTVLGDAGERAACAERARRFFAAHHTVAAAGDAYEALLRAVPAGRHASAPDAAGAAPSARVGRQLGAVQ